MQENKWFNVGNYEAIECRNCSKILSEIGNLDHHPSICPSCKIECVWYDMSNGKVIQVIPELAPKPMKEFIRWSQKELGELEMLELICNIEEIGSKLLDN